MQSGAKIQNSPELTIAGLGPDYDVDLPTTWLDEINIVWLENHTKILNLIPAPQQQEPLNHV